MNTQELTIQGYTFTAPAPYDEGHVLTANEAKALNQTYGENLRNNFAKNVTKAKEAGEVNIEALRAEFAKYADEYEFAAKRQARGPVDPVAREAQKIARNAISERLREMGKKASDLAEGKMDEMVAQLAARADFMESARKIVEARQGATLNLADIGIS